MLKRQPGRFALCPIALFLLTSQAGLAAGQWVKLTSQNFEIYTTASAKSGRDAILYFETVRSFFL